MFCDFTNMLIQPILKKVTVFAFVQVAIIFLFNYQLSFVVSTKYEPTWESLDKHPLPQWYDDAKFGIFLHWGVYSVPGICGAWFWYDYKVKKVKECVDFMQKNYKPNFTYADFAPQFRAEFYNPKDWAEIFASSGAKYVVLTSKHLEGFRNWDTKYGFNWNSMDVGPKRDLVGDLASAIRNNTDLKFGVYYEPIELWNEAYLYDQNNNYTTTDFARKMSMPSFYELVNKYKPEYIWSDAWLGSPEYWQSQEFLAWLYNDSPVKETVLVNDRWGSGVACHHGDVHTCRDKYNPKTLQNHKWENCMTVAPAWAYQRTFTLEDIQTAELLVQTLVETVSCGGNLLMDVGPTADGRIVPIFEERLRQMGAWLKINGEAIYKSQPWKYQNDTMTQNVWYTQKITENKQLVVYAFVFNWPRNGALKLGCPKPSTGTVVTFLGYSETIQWKSAEQGHMILELPVIPFHAMPSEFVWVFKMTNLS